MLRTLFNRISLFFSVFASLSLVAASGSSVAADSTAQLTEPVREISESEADQIVLVEVEQQSERERVDREAAARLRLIGSTEVEKDDHKIIRNQVAPPDNALATPDTASVVVNAEAVQLPSRDVKPRRNLGISATVIDRNITYLLWKFEGRTYSAWSTVDFNYLRTLTSFETDDTHYFFILGLGNTTSEESDLNIPDLPEYEPDSAIYFVDQDVTHPAAYKAINYLHDHYALNARDLKTAYRNQEQISQARERYRTLNWSRQRIKSLISG